MTKDRTSKTEDSSTGSSTSEISVILSELSPILVDSTNKEMDRIQMANIAPEWLLRHIDTTPKLINYVLLIMGLCNFFLLISVFQAAVLPNLGISPTLIAFLLCFQNALTWFTLNNHRLSNFPTLIPSDFVIGSLLGIAVGGSIISFILSQFFAKMADCKSLMFSNYEYECAHRSTMLAIWFWSGLVFWLNTTLSALVVIGKDELSYLQQHSYENIGLALEELQNNYNQNAVYTQPGDGTFFGSSEEQQFPTTPSQEHEATATAVSTASASSRTVTVAYGGYGSDSGFGRTEEGQPSSSSNEEAKEIFV